MSSEIIGALIALVSSLLTALLIHFLDTKRFEKMRQWQDVDQKRKELVDTLILRYDQVEACADKVINAIAETREKFILAGKDLIKGKQVDIVALSDFLDRKMLFNEMARLSVVIHAVGDETLKGHIRELNEDFSHLMGWAEGIGRIFNDKEHPYDKVDLEEDEKTIDGLVNNCLDTYSRIYKRIDKLRLEAWKIYIET